MATGGRSGGKKKPISIRSFNVSYALSGVGVLAVFGAAVDDQITRNRTFEIFHNLINRWYKRYMKPSDVQKALRSTVFARSGKVSSAPWEMKAIFPAGIGEKKTIWKFTAAAPPDAYKVGSILESGRPSGGSPKNKYYLVPLASWMQKKGRKFTTAKDIKEDLGQKEGEISRGPHKGQAASRSFLSPWEVKTTSGPARMILLLNKGLKKLKRDPRGRFATKSKRTDVMGRKVTRGKLADITTRMYLAYSTTRAIWGPEELKRKRPRGGDIKPLAAQMGLTITETAPKWFSRFAVKKLALLNDSFKEIAVQAEKKGRTYVMPDFFYKLTVKDDFAGRTVSESQPGKEGEEVSLYDRAVMSGGSISASSLQGNPEEGAELQTEAMYNAMIEALTKDVYAKKISGEEALKRMQELKAMYKIED